MSQLKTVKLHGGLEQFSKEPLEAAVNDWRDTASMLKTWFPEFRRYVIDNPQMAVVVTEKDGSNPRAITSDCIHVPFAEQETDIHVFPDMQGAGIEAALLAAGYSAFAAGAIAFVANMAISLALSAIAQAFAPKPETGQNGGPEENPSFLYNGPENVTEQGRQAPIVCGTFMTGSVVLATGIHTEQTGRYNPNMGTSADWARMATWQNRGGFLGAFGLAVAEMQMQSLA